MWRQKKKKELQKKIIRKLWCSLYERVPIRSLIFFSLKLVSFYMFLCSKDLIIRLWFRYCSHILSFQLFIIFGFCFCCKPFLLIFSYYFSSKIGWDIVDFILKFFYSNFISHFDLENQLGLWLIRPTCISRHFRFVY